VTSKLIEGFIFNITITLSCEQVKSKGVSPGVTEIGQALQSLDTKGSHASISYQIS
jgi:hypothetical protein